MEKKSEAFILEENTNIYTLGLETPTPRLYKMRICSSVDKAVDLSDVLSCFPFSRDLKAASIGDVSPFHQANKSSEVD